MPPLKTEPQQQLQGKRKRVSQKSALDEYRWLTSTHASIAKKGNQLQEHIQKK